jgi:hypothetical protein
MVDLISELLRSGPCPLSDHKNWRVVVIVFLPFPFLLLLQKGVFLLGFHTTTTIPWEHVFVVYPCFLSALLALPCLPFVSYSPQLRQSVLFGKRPYARCNFLLCSLARY